jgi:hypothetical protein
LAVDIFWQICWHQSLFGHIFFWGLHLTLRHDLRSSFWAFLLECSFCQADLRSACPCHVLLPVEKASKNTLHENLTLTCKMMQSNWYFMFLRPFLVDINPFRSVRLSSGMP